MATASRRTLLAGVAAAVVAPRAHAQSPAQTAGVPVPYGQIDQAVAALLEDLDVRGLLDDTLVVLVGEFGRTPKITPGGTKVPGRDHWPRCYSAMLAGGGIRGGAVYGSSDKIAAYPKDDPVSLEDFTATLYAALGIEPGTRLSPDGFTRPARMAVDVSKLRAVFAFATAIR